MPSNRHWPPLTKPPQLGVDDVHAWAVPLDVSQSAYDGLLATLAPDEKTRAAEFRFDAPRHRYVVARGTLRALLGTYLNLQPSEVALTTDHNKKPRLTDAHTAVELHFNVSHSGDLAIIGFANGCEIGVDVEQLREVNRLEQIAQRFFHPAEVSAVIATPAAARNLAFLRCWTGKESILKALGTGIVGNLAGFEVPVSGDWQGWVGYPIDHPPEQRSRCWLEQLTPDGDYIAAVACVESKRVVRSYTFATE